MGDKNPKAKRKLMAQQQELKKHKAEEAERERQRRWELRHPAEHPITDQKG